MRTRSIWTCFALLAVATSTASAAFVSPSSLVGGWTRPSSLVTAAATSATYQGWDRFTVAGAGNLNLPNSPGVPTGAVVDDAPWNPNGAATVEETSGLGSVLGSGNIYSTTAALNYRVTVPTFTPASGASTRYLLQVRTVGTLLDLTSPQLGGVALASLPGYQYTELLNEPFGGPGGVRVDHKFEFTSLTTASPGVISFAAREGAMSLDRVSVDTIAVPEPASREAVLLALLATVTGAALLRKV